MQVGSYVPADSCCLSVLDGIYTRMGAADNLLLGRRHVHPLPALPLPRAQAGRLFPRLASPRCPTPSRSTFLEELSDASHTLAHATSRSLVIMVGVVRGARGGVVVWAHCCVCG